jgi:hypothetical protein
MINVPGKGEHPASVPIRVGIGIWSGGTSRHARKGPGTMTSRRGRSAKHARHAGDKTPRNTSGAIVASPPNAAELASSLGDVLAEQGTDQHVATALAAQLDAAPMDQWGQIVLDSFVTHLSGEMLVMGLSALLAAPLEPAVHEQAIHMLERGREPAGLELLVALGDQGSTRAIRRAAKAALFRLDQAGVVLPLPTRTVSTVREDAHSWPVERAWANRVDYIGSQAVGIARRRPHGDATFVTAIVSDDRGVVEGHGEMGISFRALDRHVRKLALPPGAPLYEVTPEYARYRIRQGLATGERAHRAVAPDFRRWSFLLEGIDDAWEPDLEALCRERAVPAWLDRTAVLMQATEYVDWWPDPDARDGGMVNRFITDVQSALARLPGGGYNDHDPREPPYLEMLAETDYIALLWPFDRAGSAAIEACIDRHFDTLLPPQRTRRFRDAFLQMGYLADVSGRPTLCALLMTAAWALGPDSGVAPRQHPFLRQSLRKAVEVLIVL